MVHSSRLPGSRLRWRRPLKCHIDLRMRKAMLWRCGNDLHSRIVKIVMMRNGKDTSPLLTLRDETCAMLRLNLDCSTHTGFTTSPPREPLLEGRRD
eukprot:6311402-Amphidinium_carterae.1